MTCDVIEVTTRRGKREEESFHGAGREREGAAGEETEGGEQEEAEEEVRTATLTSPQGSGEEVKQTGRGL